MPVSVWTTRPGRTSSVRMALMDVTATAFSSCSSVLNTNFWLPIQCSVSLPITGRHGCTPALSTGIVRQRDIQDVGVTKVMCGAECWTDHRLIISIINIRILPKQRPQGKPAPKRLNVVSLNKEAVGTELKETLEERAQQIQISDNVVESWEAFQDEVYRKAYETIEQTKRKHQDWFEEKNDEINNLLLEKYRIPRVLENNKSPANQAAYNNIRSTVQQILQQMQDSWLKQKAEEIQNYADKNDMKRFYDAIKTVYGPQPASSSPLLSADEQKLLTEKAHILDRWAEHFDAVLNRSSYINEEAINRLPQNTINLNMGNPPTLSELEIAIHQLSSGKAPGADVIPVEVYKYTGPLLRNKLNQLIDVIWDQEIAPQESKDAFIIHLYKRKGNRQVCENHRGISLLCIAGKILARILLNRLINHLEQGLLPENQCRFRKELGTTDMIFVARQLQEKCQEQNVDLYTTFVDLTKAFDTVSRNGLWKIISKFGCPHKFIQVVRQLHDGMQAQVLDDRESSTPYPVTNGVKQGCVLAPTLFSMMFSAMLTDAFREANPGMDIRYRTDGRLFNLRRLQAKTKVHVEKLRDILFADDCALNAGRYAALHGSVLQCMQQLRTHHQYEENRGYVSACTEKPLPRTYCDSERAEASNCGQVCVPRQHTLSLCAHRR